MYNWHFISGGNEIIYKGVQIKWGGESEVEQDPGVSKDKKAGNLGYCKRVIGKASSSTSLA